MILVIFKSAWQAPGAELVEKPVKMSFGHDSSDFQKRLAGAWCRAGRKNLLKWVFGMILVIFKSAWHAPGAELVEKSCKNEFWA